MGKMSLDQLQQKYRSCSRCPALCQSRSQTVFGVGNPHARVVFIGEAPGAHEDQQGIPFCGQSGKVLNELLTAVGISREDIFITNTILCRPENNRNPATEEVENCRERLDQTLALIQPKVIVTIGNFATERILGKKGIKTLRGKQFQAKINNGQITVVPVIHPANYLYSGRNPTLFAEMKEDFQTIAMIMNGERKQQKIEDFL